MTMTERVEVGLFAVVLIIGVPTLAAMLHILAS